jgi:hypothetical protein
MRCEYSRWGQLSSEKRETLTRPGAKKGSGHAEGSVTPMVVGHYRALPEPAEAMSCAAKSLKTLRFRTLSRLYLYETLFERSAQGLEGMAAEFAELIQEAHAMVRPRHLPRQRRSDEGTIRARGPPIRPDLVPAMVKRLASQSMRRSEGSRQNQFRLAS